MTTFWNSFSAPQTVEIRDYLLNYLAQRCHVLPPFVTQSLIRVLMRVSKLGWNAAQQHRDVCKAVTKFLAHTVGHCIIGLQMLDELVQQMNSQTKNLSLSQHRKIAVSFRDSSLRFVLQLTLSTLGQIRDGEVQVDSEAQGHQLRSVALDLALHCLNFDYIGTNPDDASEEAGTIQIPTSWRSIIQDEATLKLFIDMFASSRDSAASTCVELLVQMASCRRSLFENQVGVITLSPFCHITCLCLFAFKHSTLLFLLSFHYLILPGRAQCVPQQPLHRRELDSQDAAAAGEAARRRLLPPLLSPLVAREVELPAAGADYNAVVPRMGVSRCHLHHRRFLQPLSRGRHQLEQHTLPARPLVAHDDGHSLHER
jgi:hypothetical protein